MLRVAVDADVEMIRSWRNHSQVRRASIMRAEITPEGHREWWKRVSADPRAHVLIFEYAEAPAGVVTFKDHDPATCTAEWGFFLDVDRLKARGELLAAWIELERAAVAYGFDVLGLAVLGGRSLASNAAVLELHRRNGFVVVPERGYTTEIDGTPQQVVWTELRADERSRET